MEHADTIFTDALALPLEQRARFLDRACGADAALRAEVESLLAAYPAAADLFARGASLPDAGLDETDPAIGARVGPYELISFVAAGGMGSVYLAERVDDSFRRRVAVKLIRPGIHPREILARFRRERQVLADLEHPHIARLFDGGSTDEGLPYLVMEYVDGVPIDCYCREHGLSLRERLRLFLQVCDAVAYAHRHLVIHRDLKPGNIFVDQSGRVKLLDFGIAKVLDASLDPEGAEPATMMLRALTPRYASPEQLAGTRISTASDVYSLGTVLYELLADAAPFALEGLGPADIERVLLTQVPARPSRTVSGRLARQLSGDLDTIVLRALSREPERRYAGVKELAADLERHLAGQPVLARPDTTGYRLAKFAGRNKALVGGTVTVLLVLTGAFLLTLRAYGEAAAQKHQAQKLAYVNALAATEAAILNNQTSEARRRLETAPPRLRGWEWRHLAGRIDGSRRTWRAHEGGITRVALRRDGLVIATASLDQHVKTWSADTGAPVCAWGPLPSGVESVVFAPDGASLVAGLSDGEVLSLPLAGDVTPRHVGRGGKWAMVDIRPDGDRIAAGFEDGTVCVWDQATGIELGRWQAERNFALACYSGDGRYLLTGGGDGVIHAWDGLTHRLLGELGGHTRRVYALAASADGRRLASGSMDRTARVWDLPTMTPRAVFREHRATVGGLVFTPDGAAVVSTGADGRVLRWNADTAEIDAEYRGHESDPYSIAMRRDGARFVTGDWRGTVKVWDAGSADVRSFAVRTFPEMIPAIRDVALDPGGRRVAGAIAAPVIPIWSLDGGEDPLFMEAGSLGAARGVAFSPDGALLASAHESGLLSISDASSGALTGQARAHRGAAVSLAVDPQVDRLATGGEDSTVVLWSWAGPRELRVLHAGCAIIDLEFARDGQWLAGAGSDGSVHVWAPDTGREIPLADRLTGEVHDLFPSADGRTLGAVLAGGVIRLWDTRTGSCLGDRILSGHPLLTACFSADAGLIAAGGADQVVHLFEAATGESLVDLHGHVGRVFRLRFSVDGQRLISGSLDGTVRVWEAPRRVATLPLSRRAQRAASLTEDGP